MKIKRPSLKGIKNTKYLGHFAQDKYIHKGHNLSGVFNVSRQPSAIEMMAPSNPFDITTERNRRIQQIGETQESYSQMPTSQQLLEQEQQALDQANRIAGQALLYEQKAGQGFTDAAVYARGSRTRESAARQRAAAAAGRATKKKFVEEV